MSTYLVNRSPSSAMGFKTLIDMLGFFGWLVSIKKEMLEPVKVKCIFMGWRKGIVGNKLWRLDDVTSKVVLYRNMGFNESGEYKKTFIGFGVGTSSVQVLQGVEFEVEPQEDHAFEMEPLRNVSQGAGSHKVQTQDLIYYHSARDRFYNGKLVQTLLEGHSILSLEGSLSGDCDVEKNGKWSCIYAVEIQEHQMICIRLDIASADVGMLDKFDRGLQIDVHVFVDFDYAIGRSIIVMEGDPCSEVPAMVEVAVYRRRLI
ncbi:hypothetical protein Tco_0033925 [Tanacetum coccineum]